MKKLFAALCLMMMTGLLAGCKKKAPNTEIEPTNTLVTQPLFTTPFGTMAPIQTTELPIYTLSADQTELVAVTALVSREQQLTEQTVVDAVVDALADSAFYVKVNEVSVKDRYITVDFDGSMPPVTKVSKDVEELILDAFAQSIIDNIAGCNEVGFSVDGNAYKSANLKMEQGAAYLRR